MSRVAYLVSEYFAPSHTFVRREVAALRQAGLEVVPFSVQAANGDAGVEAIFNRPFFEYPLALISAFALHPRKFFSSWWLSLRHRPLGLRGLVWSQFHFVEAMLLAKLIKAAKCKRLHNHFANSAATVGMIASHYSGNPWSFTLHGISETDYPAGMLLREKLERADFVACASYFMRAQAMRQVDFNHWHKMHIVRCGVNMDDMPVLAAPLPSTALTETVVEQLESVRIITVGRLSAEKGYFGLLEILGRLRDQGYEFAATIVGDGPSGQAIHEMARDLSLDACVRFTGALSENETLLEIHGSDVMVLPSLMEGLPVVLLEALAMRKAVVASQVAGIPELVTDGVTGLLFTPSDWNHLEQQLLRLLSDPQLRQDLGNQGFERVKGEFGSATAASKLLALFAG